jgi:protein phosphatase
VIPVDSPHLQIATQSHPGETGKNNEDAFSVTSYRLEAEGPPSIVAIVADGVGGHRAGEIASGMAVEIVAKRVGEASGIDPLTALRAAIVEAGRAISTAAEAFPERQGMASTVVVAWIIGRRLFTGYVGDSRIYVRHRGRLQQATVDHSWVQEAIEHAIITPEEAHSHPHAHILRRYLGGNLEPQPDFRLRLSPDESVKRSEANQGVELEAGDQVLLCSDGLTDLVSDAEIEEALRNPSGAEAADSLVVLARARGGHDNITTVLIGVPGSGRPARRRLSSPLVLAAAIAGLVLCSLLGVGLALGLGFWPWG